MSGPSCIQACAAQPSDQALKKLFLDFYGNTQKGGVGSVTTSKCLNPNKVVGKATKVSFSLYEGIDRSPCLSLVGPRVS